MLLGVDYYPEQWNPSLVEEDLDTILELGCNAIRIGEFAWHIMERSEGRYDFSFFDGIIARAAARGLEVVFGTPTATPPAWLAKKYPDILSEFDNGRKRAYGGRRNYCFNSARYLEYSEKIIAALIGHYRHEPAIAAWQIDNEFGHEGSDLCYCDSCGKMFREFLREKFSGDIDALNRTYGTVFWSQEYNDFDEIPLPLPTIAVHNPALRLDWERFRHVSIERYCAMQCRVIRGLALNAVVIHDFSGGGLGKHCDFSALARHLDVVAYNNYPVWGGQKEPLPPHEIAFGLDYMRGLKRRNFWITEAIMGAQGHDVTGFAPRPNQAKMWSYQAMAHGCESLFYFRYRGATKGAEQFCYGVLDADNVKRRKFREVQSFFGRMRECADMLAAPVTSRVCLLYDYDSLASFRIQRQSLLLDCEAEMKKIYKSFYRKNVSVDIMASREDFSAYGIVVVPLMTVWTEAFLARLKRYVDAGGIAILTYRTAVKDDNNNLTFGKTLPVQCGDLAGVEVAETESLQEAECLPLRGAGAYAGCSGRGGVFRDFLLPRGAEVLFSYGDAFYDEYAAVTVNRFGRGRAYYLGCSLDDATLALVAERVLAEAGIPVLDSPENVEVVVRECREGRYVFVINHGDRAVEYEGATLAPFEARIEKV